MSYQHSMFCPPILSDSPGSPALASQHQLHPLSRGSSAHTCGPLRLKIQGSPQQQIAIAQPPHSIQQGVFDNCGSSFRMDLGWRAIGITENILGSWVPKVQEGRHSLCVGTPPWGMDSFSHKEGSVKRRVRGEPLNTRPRSRPLPSRIILVMETQGE